MGACDYDCGTFQSQVLDDAGYAPAFQSSASARCSSYTDRCGSPKGYITSTRTAFGGAIASHFVRLFPFGNFRLLAILVPQHIIQTLNLCCV